MHPKLLQFLKDYLAWVEAGAVEPNVYFDRSNGLCLQISKYLRRSGLPLNMEVLVKHEFKMLVSKDFPYNIVYPFNKNGDDYRIESENHLIYANNQRINWVKGKIANA